MADEDENQEEDSKQAADASVQEEDNEKNRD